MPRKAAYDPWKELALSKARLDRKCREVDSTLRSMRAELIALVESHKAQRRLERDPAAERIMRRWRAESA